MAISAWTDSAKQLSGLLFGDPAQRDAALERELNAAKVKQAEADILKMAEETRGLQYKNQGLEAFTDPSLFDFNRAQEGMDDAQAQDYNRRLLQSRSFLVAQDPSKFGDVNLFSLGESLRTNPMGRDVENNMRLAMGSAGKTVGQDDAFTTEGARSNITYKTNEAIRQRNAQPRSETEVLAAALGSLPMNERVELARMKQLPSEVAQYEYGVTTPAYREYEMQNKSKAPGFRMTTDANGNPVIEYGTEFGELQKSTQGALEKELIAANQLKDTIAKARTLMNDPTNFGSAGALKAFGQDVGQQAQGLGMLFAPEQTQEITSQLQSIGGDIVSADNFSTENVQLNAIYSGLLYQTASAIAGQSGRDLSDKDLKLAQQMLGPPQALFSSPQKFGSQLNIVEDLLNLKGGALQKAYDTGAPPRFDSNAVNDISGALAPLNLPGRINSPINPGSVGQGTNPALTTPYDQITPEPVQITSDADYEMLPSGTQFIAPDGTVRVKP